MVLVLQKGKEAKTRMELNGKRVGSKNKNSVLRLDSNTHCLGCSLSNAVTTVSNLIQASKFYAAQIVGHELCSLNQNCHIELKNGSVPLVGSEHSMPWLQFNVVTSAPQNILLDRKLTFVPFIVFDNFFKASLSNIPGI